MGVVQSANKHGTWVGEGRKAEIYFSICSSIQRESWHKTVA